MLEMSRIERKIKEDLIHFYMLQINLDKMQEHLEIEKSKEDYNEFMINILVKEIRAIKRELKKYE